MMLHCMQPNMFQSRTFQEKPETNGVTLEGLSDRRLIAEKADVEEISNDNQTTDQSDDTKS